MGSMARPFMTDGRCNLIAERLIELRLKYGLSQRGLAHRLRQFGVKMDKSTIARIETNQRHVTDLELRALARVFGVSCSNLLCMPLLHRHGVQP